jgi:hypothetical protein
MYSEGENSALSDAINIDVKYEGDETSINASSSSPAFVSAVTPMTRFSHGTIGCSGN